MDREEVVDALVLRDAPGIGDRGFKFLIGQFASAGAALHAAEREESVVRGLGGAVTTSLREALRNRHLADREAKRAEALGFALIPYGSPEYPKLLGEICDPPAVLYATALLRPEDETAVAVVGSRRASTHGVRFARRLAGELASAGITVVSGLAYGVDAAAHQGAIEAGGRTLAVFGAGLDVIYPRRNRELAQRVRSSGAWISELPLGSEPLAHHFPRRNRIISGLSLGVVVVEAGSGSGSLITASAALEQGREVFAVPGLPGSYNSRGAHELLRSGAKLVESAADVLDELPPSPPRPKPDAPAAAPEPPPQEFEALWAALEDAPLHIDEVAVRAGLGAHQAAAGLMELALGGYAVEWPGKRYARRGGK